MIIVFGSINIDLVARVGVLPRAGETVAGPGYEVIPGGKGANQALAARRAGAEVALVGAVGRDGFAEPALSLLGGAGIDLAGVAPVDAPTGVAFIAVDPAGQNQIVVAAGANAAVRAAALDRLAPAPRDTLLMQWEVPEAEILAAARWARARDLRVMLNRAPAGPVSADLAALLDIVVVNEHEVLALGAGLGVTGEPDAVAAELSARHGLAVAVTLGAEGAVCWADGIRHESPAYPVEVVDTTAAGDTFCGALAAALDRRRGLETAIEFAAAAGSLACARPGAQTSIPELAAIEAAAAILAEQRNPPHRRTTP
ncbi:ribokinase [Phreatobacter cathodiphilus]|uniref:Ribokinase n=1 Tax=Phreatobacter cathodiphilus TaxID=1868589 RepID=A0A2S0NGG5_9HYPH|nr:ribokinase [Phreatobacter cathodiphilus]AVO47021.1 ribokinase [Phreatobacter cathodiphilus]